MQIYKKHKAVILTVLLIVVITGTYWFFNKFYPSQTGEWSQKDKNNFDESIVANSGWEGSSFWTSMDFPGKQKVCLNIYSKSNFSKNINSEIPVSQAPRAYFYPEAGTLSDLFSQMSPAQVEEKIRQGKPYYIGHLGNNIVREGKDLFFAGENEKFLIPTKSIFSKQFPTKEIPSPSNNTSALPYANVLINLPEGILITDGKGVFVMSQTKLFLIRSPEVFESLGYDWGNIKQMDNYEKTFNSYLSGNLIDFNAAHPNGTILKNNGDIFLVWGEKLYKLTSEEQSNYFPDQPSVEVSQKNLQADCLATSGSNKATCCISNIDTRLNPPSYSPFLNTLRWDTSQITTKDQVEKIDWQSKMEINKENTLKRLGSFKNFILYGLGIAK